MNKKSSLIYNRKITLRYGEKLLVRIYDKNFNEDEGFHISQYLYYMRKGNRFYFAEGYFCVEWVRMENGKIQRYTKRRMVSNINILHKWDYKVKKMVKLDYNKRGFHIPQFMEDVQLFLGKKLYTV